MPTPIVERKPCSKCGAMALPSTLALTGGLCMPCKNKADEIANRKEFKMVSPRLDLELSAVRAMPFFQVCDRVWDLVVNASYASNFTDPTSNYPESSFAVLLEEPWRIAYAVHAMEYDVLAGGFRQYFDNQGDVLNQSVLSGLRLIGATEHFNIFQDAVSNQEDDAALSALTSRYYDACKLEDPRELLASYIVANFDRYIS